MATWEGLRGYIKSNYVVGGEDAESLLLDFALEENRSQKVMVSKLMLGDAEWVEIATPICQESELAARDAMLRNGQMIVGGLAMDGEGMVYFRHSLPLKDLDLDEFEVPFHLAVQFGDRLEREIVGVNRY
jgi:hypothetical protein